MKNTVRRYSQILFFILFLILLIQTEYKGEDTLGLPVRIFLDIDPLLAVSVISAAKGIFLFIAGVLLAWGLFILIGKFVGKLAAQSGWGNKLENIAFKWFPLVVITAFFAWAIFPFGFDRGLPLMMALGFVTVAVTFLLGRIFCGWICPMGAVLQFTSWLKKDSIKKRRDKNQYQNHQRWKYYILISLLIAAILGFQIVGLMDPISMVIRSFSIVVSPLINQFANGAYDLAYDTNNDIVTGIADSVYETIAYPNVLSFNQPHFVGAVLVAIVFIFVLALNIRRPRYWCRVLCPLGAMLGTISRHTPYRLQMTADKCNSCGHCSSNCQGACDPEFKEGWRPSECFVCFHCVDACPSGALTFSYNNIKNEDPEKRQIGMDLKKRRAFQAVAASLIAVPVLKATEQYKQEIGGARSGPSVHNPLLIRPPGALVEPEFLNRCIRCGECMKVCPTNGLHPATLEAGLEGMWTPILVPRIGYCEYYCTLCGQVCPTGAIEELEVDVKIKKVIGTAFFDVNRCLPYAFGVDCIVCEEHCPTAPKAIWFEEVERTMRPEEENPAALSESDYSDTEEVWEEPAETNQTKEDEPGSDPYTQDPYADPYGGASISDKSKILKPKIDLDLCIGCGICEKVCVVADKPAVYITSVGEDRSASNRITFEGSYENY